MDIDEKVSALYKIRKLDKEEYVPVFDKLIQEIFTDPKPEYVIKLCAVFYDEVYFHEVMYGLIHEPSLYGSVDHSLPKDAGLLRPPVPGLPCSAAGTISSLPTFQPPVLYQSRIIAFRSLVSSENGRNTKNRLAVRTMLQQATHDYVRCFRKKVHPAHSGEPRPQNAAVSAWQSCISGSHPFACFP